MHLDVDFISKVLVSAQIHNGAFPQDSLFSVDTRTLQKGDVFVALKGERVDGHDFIEQALEKDVSGLILANDRKNELLKKFGSRLLEKHLLFVDDTLQALVDLAKNWRAQFTYPVVAITGSVGKTTTKEMVRNILKLTDKNYLVSFGNQNTLVGISLNILKMRPFHHVAIFEVGIGKRGVMTHLADLLRPTFSVITKIGYSHMEGLGDLSSVAHEKREVFSRFSDSDIGVINGDQQELSHISYSHPVVRFGYKTTNQIQARKVVIDHNVTTFIAKIYDKKYPVALQGCHQARITNALAAITVGYLLQIPNELLIQGVEMPIVVNGRFQVIEHSSGSVLINDGYNANPDSVKAALLAFEAYQTDKQKIVVFGDMLELGIDSQFWHRQIGRFLSKITNLHHVVLIGSLVEATQKTLPLGVKSTLFATSQEAFDFLKNMLLEKNKVFLFKGSNSVKLSGLVEQLRDL